VIVPVGCVFQAQDVHGGVPVGRDVLSRDLAQIPLVPVREAVEERIERAVVAAAVVAGRSTAA
jgi:hypothetical protein